MADATHARRTAQRFVRLLAANGTTSALVFGSHFPQAQQTLFEEAEQARAADRERARGLRPQPPAGARGHTGAGLRREQAPARSLARPRQAALRRHAALLRVVHRPRCSRRAARCSTTTPPTRCSPATSTRAPARSRSSKQLFPRREGLHRHLRGRRAARATAACSPTTSTCPTTSSRDSRDATHRGRALPVEQRVPVERHLRHGPPRRARRALRDGHGRRAPAPA